MNQLKLYSAQSYYTDEEQKMLVSYFVNKDDNCKKHFIEYLENFITVHGKKISNEEAQKANLRAYNNKGISANLLYYDYSSKNKYINNQENDNIVTYILTHTEFNPTSSRLKALQKLRPNWNHVNRNGDNALHVAARSGKFRTIDTLIKEYSVSPDIKNKHDEYFINLLLKPQHFMYLDTIGNSAMNILYIEISKLNMITAYLQTYSNLLEKSELSKVNKMNIGLESIHHKFLNYIEINEEVFSKGTVNYYYESYKAAKDILNYYMLEKSTQKEDAIKIKKNKI